MLSVWLKRVRAILIILGTIGAVLSRLSQPGGPEDPAVLLGGFTARILLLVLAIWLLVSAHRSSRRLKMQKLQAGQQIPQQAWYSQPLSPYQDQPGVEQP